MKHHIFTLQDPVMPSVFVDHFFCKCSCNMQKPYAYESNKMLNFKNRASYM